MVVSRVPRHPPISISASGETAAVRATLEDFGSREMAGIYQRLNISRKYHQVLQSSQHNFLLPDPRGAILHEAFQIPSVRLHLV